MSKNTSQRNPQESLEDVAKDGIEVFKEYQSVIITIAVVFVLGVLIFSRRADTEEAGRENAWKSLYEAEKLANDKLDAKLEERAKKLRGSSVEPFLIIKRSQELYAKGTKEDLEEALALLKDFVLRFKHFEQMNEMAQQKIKAIEAELAHAPSWMPKKDIDKEANEKTHGDHPDEDEGHEQDKEDAEGHGEDDGHGHGADDGHGHGDEPNKDAKPTIEIPAKDAKPADKDSKSADKDSSGSK